LQEQIDQEALVVGQKICRDIQHLISGTAGNFETHIKKRFEKERHTRKPP